jgi:hypothetical protein
MNKLTAFQLNLDQAIVFFEICKEMNLNTEEERAKVLSLMAEEGQVERMWTTYRTKEKFMADLARKFEVMHVKSTYKETESPT